MSSIPAAVDQAALDELIRENKRLRAELDAYSRYVSPKHFYSPIPDLDEVRRYEDRIFAPPPPALPGIDLRVPEQLALVVALSAYYPEIPFQATPVEGLRYYYQNPAYTYGDAIILHSMIRHLRPKRIIEVGSGFSSAVTLDTNELFMGGNVQCTFIEPNPEVLFNLLRGDDRRHVRIIAKRLQEIDLGVFGELEAGDILFVDSTHVAKVFSDVNLLFFEVFSRLPPGVHLHLHDIFYPFEYRKDWLYEGRAWNEAYLLRAFLQFNPCFQIEYFATYLNRFHRDFLVKYFPLCGKNAGGNIWLKRV